MYIIVSIFSAMFVEEPQCMSYFMDDNRKDNAPNTESYPLGLEVLLNSTNKGVAAEKKRNNMKYVLRFISNIPNSSHKHDGIDVSVSPRSKTNASAFLPMLH